MGGGEKGKDMFHVRSLPMHWEFERLTELDESPEMKPTRNSLGSLKARLDIVRLLPRIFGFQSSKDIRS